MLKLTQQGAVLVLCGYKFGTYSKRVIRRQHEGQSVMSVIAWL